MSLKNEDDMHDLRMEKQVERAQEAKGEQSLDDDTEICAACNGSGEGMHDGSTCECCDGKGELPL